MKLKKLIKELVEITKHTHSHFRLLSNNKRTYCNLKTREKTRLSDSYQEVSCPVCLRLHIAVLVNNLNYSKEKIYDLEREIKNNKKPC